jgi:hypothetical protein
MSGARLADIATAFTHLVRADTGAVNADGLANCALVLGGGRELRPLYVEMSLLYSQLTTYYSLRARSARPFSTGAQRPSLKTRDTGTPARWWRSSGLL